MNRRSLLSIIGLAPAAAVIGVRGNIIGSTPIPGGYPPITSTSGENCATLRACDPEISRSFFRQNGIPDFVRERARDESWRDARYLKRFDADIESSKSFSLATRRRLQAERNVDRMFENEMKRWSFGDMRNSLEAKIGNYWPFNGLY